jgi:outer membrane protein assembly factor BamB
VNVAVAAVLAHALALPGATPEARQVYGITWTKTAVEVAPCALSIVMPASEAERCASWTRRESSGPAFHAALGVIVVGGSDKRLRGLDAADGHILWEHATPGAVLAQPVIAEDGAYVGTDDARVVRVDVASGRERWATAVDAEVTEPVVVHEDVVYVVTGNDSTYALSRLTGEALWVSKHPLPRGITLRGQGRPLVLDVPAFDGLSKRLYVGHASGRLSVLDRRDGAVLQELDISRGDTFGDLDADPIFHPAMGGRVIVASQTRGITAIDPKNNIEQWTTKEPGITRLANGGAPMIVAAGAGKVLGLDAATGAIRWRFTFEKGAPTRIVVKGGRVHVGSDRGALYVVDLFSGRPLQYAGSGNGVAADLALWQDMLFYTSTAGTVTALSSGWPGVVSQSSKNDRARWP